MSRRTPMWCLLLFLASAACSDGGPNQAAPTTAPAAATSTVSTEAEPATSSTSPPTTQARVTTATTAPPTTAPVTAAARARVEPNAAADLPLGSNKSQAYAVLGNPTTTGADTDRADARYDFLRWEFSGSRGLTLYYRSLGVTSPRLTHWQITAPGPATARGIRVGDAASAVVAAYGPLAPTCCGAQMASTTEGSGKLVVLVDRAWAR